MKKLFTFVSLLLTPLFAMAAFPAQLNNFQPGNVIRSSDWNSIETEIGTRIGSYATGTPFSLNWIIRNANFSTTSLMVGRTATTTIAGDGATSTFSGGIYASRPRFTELNASNCDVKGATDGTLYCGTDSGAGSSFLYPFPSDATSTILRFTSGLISLASSTIQDLHSDTVNATTLALTGTASLSGFTNNGGGTTTSFVATQQASSTILTASRQLFGAGLSTCSTALTWTGGVFSCNSSLTSASSTLLSDGNNWSGLNRYSAGIISSASSTFQFVNLGNATSTNFETTQIKVGTLSGVLKASNGGVTGSASTSDLPEGSNSYWTSLRATTSVSSLIAGTTTTALAEGSNLYYTAQRVRDLIQSAGTLLVSTTTAQSWNALQTFTTISLTSGTSTSFATTQATSSVATISRSLNLNWLATGLLKVTNGSVGLATAGTDYENPLTFSTSGTGLNLWNARSGNTVSFNTIAAGTNITLSTTTNSNTIVISSTGGGSAYPFTNTTLGGSTSTLIAFTNGIISLASSTFQTLNFGNATGTSATTSNLFTSGQVVMQSNSTSTINGVNIAGLGGSGTSTFSNAGINLLEGCFARNGVCATTNAASGANGAVQFANGGSVSGDANWFYWDNTNKRLGIGTSSPFARLAVGGQVVADYFTATSTSPSTFPFASTTAINARSICLDGDVCRTTWPTGGGSAYPFTNTALGGSTSTLITFVNGFTSLASSTAHILNVGTQYITGLLRNTTTGDVLANESMYIVSTSTSNGHFTSIQSALDAVPTGGGKVHVRCGTYTLSGTVGLIIKKAGTVLEGEGICTQLNFDQSTTGTAIGWNTSGLTNTQVRNLYINQTNGTYGGVGINASNTPILLVENVKIQGTGTSTQIIDSANQSFYQKYVNLDLRSNNTCFDIGGNPVNDNQIDNVRCGMIAGGNGYGIYVNSNTANGAQNWLVNRFNSEPVGAGTNLTAFKLIRAVNWQINAPYIETNGIAYNIGSDSQRITFNGGEFFGNTTYTNNGKNIQFLNVDMEGQAMNRLTASSSIADISSTDASAHSLLFSGNGTFAKTGDIIRAVFNNVTDSGVGLRVINPGTGASIRVEGGDIVTTLGKVGVGTTSPYAKLSVVGEVVGSYFTATSTTATSTFSNGLNITGGCFAINGTCLSVGGGSISGSGASGQVSFWTGASTLAGSNNFIWDNTNARLGLGTTSPWAKLSIVDTDATRPAFVLATSSDISSTGILAELNSQLSLFRNKDWWNIHLGGSTSSARFAMNSTTMFGRTNSDTLMVQVDPMNTATLPTQTTADTILDGGVIFDELIDGGFGVTTLATSSDYRGQASGCYDGGAWNYIRANELVGAVANEGGWLRGASVFNMRTSVGAAPTAVAGGTMVASGTPVMEVTICSPTVGSVLAGSSTAIMQGLFGFGFGDTAGGSAFMSSTLGGPANGSWIGASTSDNWLFYSADGAIAVGNDTGVATATTKTTARTFRIAKTATATYAYIFNNNTGLWESIGSHTTRQTSREFTWFIGTQLPGATGVRHDLLFRNLKVWYSPSYRF